MPVAWNESARLLARADDADHAAHFPDASWCAMLSNHTLHADPATRALAGLSDAGAHVGTVCDASFSTFMLSHWVQGRPEGRLPLERAVEMMSGRNARYLGLADWAPASAGVVPLAGTRF